MDTINSHPGEILALLTAITWALAVVFFKKSGEAVHPIGLNLFKDLLALVLFIPTVWILGQTHFRQVPSQEYLMLLLSGALGIGISDTLFFKSLNVLGAGLSAIVDCLYSPFIIVLSIFWLDERLAFWQVIGAAMIISAVLSIARERNGNGAGKKAVLLGIVWGALAMACNAISVVMIKPILDRSPLLWVTEVRIVGGVIVLLIVLLFHPARRTILKSIHAPKRWGYTLAGSLVGGYSAVLLWLAGMKYTQASVASALNQTSNIFIFIFAAFLLRERMTRLRVAAVVMAVAGAALVTFG